MNEEVRKLRIKICEIETWLLEALIALYDTQSKLNEIERQENTKEENSQPIN